MSLLSCNGFSPISLSCFVTKSIDTGNIKLPFRVACEASMKPLSIPARRRQQKLGPSDERFPPVKLMTSGESAQTIVDDEGMSSSCHYTQVKFLIEYEEKVGDIKQKLLESIGKEDPVESLMFVDAIQRHGVAQHYQDEIQTIIKQHYMKSGETIRGYSSLHDVALAFRLFRQRGYHVSADVFSSFKGRDGRFDKEKLRQDVRGLLELYEAAQLVFQGENILDEAECFSSNLLHDCLEDMDYKWSNIVRTRLRHPYHKSITKLTENSFEREIRGRRGWEEKLAELSKMEFVFRQSIHQDELFQVSKWWGDLGLTSELKLARNQPLKWYTWSMAVLINDTSFSAQRVELTKSIAFIYLIDDIFDLYGTPQELAIFTEAVEKWDYAAMDMLPDYSKMCYKALLSTTNQIGHMICGKHGFNPIDSLKKRWADLCNAFLVEAKWFASRDLPSAQEYLANGKVSSGVHLVLVHLFFLLGHGGNNRCAFRLDDTSTLISSVATILRLWDDLGSAKDEQQNGKDGSYLECYMKDNHGVTRIQAREHVLNTIAREWKCLNKECFHVSSSSLFPFQEACLNLARMVPVMYSYDDDQRLPDLEEYIDFMLRRTSLEHHFKTKQEHFI